MRLHSFFFCTLAILAVSVPLSSSAQTATIDAGTVYQTIEGFGGATPVWEASYVSDADLQLLYSSTPGTGIGLSLFRVDMVADGSCSSVNGTCGDSGKQILHVLQTAQNTYGARVWSAPWSPPASMKTNGTTVCNNGSGAGSLASGSFAAYATYISNYIASMAQQGINLYAFSVQNEPDYCPTSYDGASWSAQNIHDFIKNNLGPTLASNGQSGVKIIAPESYQYSDFTNMLGTTMNDSSAAAYVSIVAFHDYDNASSISNPYNGKSFWETEVSAAPGYGPSLCGGCWDPSMADALMWSQVVYNNIVVGQENAFSYWYLVTPNNGTDNQGLIGGASNNTPRKFLYALGNWSLFIRPGWVMVAATNSPQSGVKVAAFKNPSTGAFAIVAINSNSSPISQSFSLSGLSSTSVTPYVTDANNNLAGQSAISASANSFTATLSASSVTTFVSSGNGPGTPTDLTATMVE